MVKKAIIVGAGINGLCLAQALNERGYQVDIFDRHAIPNPISPSSLEVQIIRPLYVENERLSPRVHDSLKSWRRLFKMLGENFFMPTGVVAVSRHEGDWADRALMVMREYSLPFKLVSGSVLGDLLPAMNLENIRMAVLADMGGQIRGRALMHSLYEYLKEQGVRFHAEEEVIEVDIDQTSVTSHHGKYSADWVFVTANHAQLVPNMGLELSQFLGSYCDLLPPIEYRAYWRFAPVWVDLGQEHNCWGVPRMNGDLLRVGAGSLSDHIDEEDSEIFAKLEDVYSDIIKEFERYQIQKFERVPYFGNINGDFMLRREKGCVALAADSGHGFKFAPQNAQAIAQALEDDTLTIAARQIAGI